LGQRLLGCGSDAGACCDRAIGAAAAIQGMLELLTANEKALEYFKGSIVGGAWAGKREDV
jgi:hypothetical protein